MLSTSGGDWTRRRAAPGHSATCCAQSSTPRPPTPSGSASPAGCRGVGDFRGVIAHLDHLTWLGVDALWLTPVMPSPDADWGYDVSDYCEIHTTLGTLADLDALLSAAHRRGLRVLLDMVPNHTSIEHPWFRDHPERYVWADRRPTAARRTTG
jgi:glycosidase